VDDILDIMGDPETMGKPVGSDLSQRRGVLAIENGEGAGNNTATAIATSDSVEQMLSRLRDSGAVEVAQMQAAEMAQRAQAALERLPEALRSHGPWIRRFGSL
jgi:octaprenyl-diphosphate synthase